MMSASSSGNGNSNNMAPMTDEYNQWNASQSTVWEKVQPLFDLALKQQQQQPQSTEHENDNNNNTTFRVADLGCATGGNSIAPLSFAAHHLPQSCSSLEIFLVDLPGNSWNTVVKTVTPEAIRNGSGDKAEKTKRNDSSDIFIHMVGKSFYEQCVAPNTLDLSYSLVACHWMKSYAGDIPTGLVATDPHQNTDPTLLQAWQMAGAKDFEDFVRARYLELKVGGAFIGVVSAPKQSTDNQIMPWAKVAEPLHEALLRKVKDPQALASCVLPVCYRTEEDVRAGFQNCCKTTHEEDTGCWNVEICVYHETKDPVRESLERGEITPTEYAKAVIQSYASVCHPTCVASLVNNKNDNGGLSKNEAEQLLKEAYTECIDVIAANPETYNLDVSFWYVLARKIR